MTSVSSTAAEQYLSAKGWQSRHTDSRASSVCSSFHESSTATSIYYGDDEHNYSIFSNTDSAIVTTSPTASDSKVRKPKRARRLVVSTKHASDTEVDDDSPRNTVESGQHKTAAAAATAAAASVLSADVNVAGSPVSKQVSTITATDGSGYGGCNGAHNAVFEAKPLTTRFDFRTSFYSVGRHQDSIGQPRMFHSVDRQTRTDCVWNMNVKRWMKKHGVKQKPKLTYKQRNALKHLFMLLDVDGSMYLDKDELDTALRLCGVKRSRIKTMVVEMLQMCGKDLHGELDFNEFLEVMTVMDTPTTGSSSSGSSGSSFASAMSSFKRKSLLQELCNKYNFSS
jgi:EF-hand domain pair